MEKEKYVVIKQTYSVYGGKNCVESIVNYLSYKNAFGGEIWKPNINDAVRIPMEVCKFYGFEDGKEKVMDDREYGLSVCIQTIEEAEYNKTKHRLI